MGEVDFAAMRAAMVASQLRTSDVNDSAVIAAMSAVPREDFVPASRRETAYTDRPVPLGEGRHMNPPLATGRLLAALEIGVGDTVLLLGDATGYAAALLAAMGAQVTAVGEGAAPAGLSASVTWVKGAPAKGHAKGAPYDAVMIDGAVAELPAALVDQLAEGGRAAFGLAERGVTRLCVGRKAGGVIGTVGAADMEMPELAAFPRKAAEFTF